MSTSSKATGSLKSAFAKRVPDPEANSFIEQALKDAAADEVPELTQDQLATILADFWSFGSQRKGRAPVIRLATIPDAPGLERLEIIQPDAPFLVDSVMGEIAERGLSVRAMFHPIVTINRDKAGLRSPTGTATTESMIQVILERVGSDREAALKIGRASCRERV